MNRLTQFSLPGGGTLTLRPVTVELDEFLRPVTGARALQNQRRSVPSSGVAGRRLTEVEAFIRQTSPEQFIDAGYWYRNFERPGDDEVADITG